MEVSKTHTRALTRFITKIISCGYYLTYLGVNKIYFFQFRCLGELRKYSTENRLWPFELQLNVNFQIHCKIDINLTVKAITQNNII